MYTVTFIPRNDMLENFPGYWRAENKETGANAHALTPVDALADLIEQQGGVA